MGELAKRFRNLGSDQHGAVVNHCIFNFKLDPRADPAATPATVAAQPREIHHSTALDEPYRMVYASPRRPRRLPRWPRELP